MNFKRHAKRAFVTAALSASTVTGLALSQAHAAEPSPVAIEKVDESEVTDETAQEPPTNEVDNAQPDALDTTARTAEPPADTTNTASARSPIFEVLGENTHDTNADTNPSSVREELRYRTLDTDTDTDTNTSSVREELMDRHLDTDTNTNTDPYPYTVRDQLMDRPIIEEPKDHSHGNNADTRPSPVLEELKNHTHDTNADTRPSPILEELGENTHDTNAD
ncbi:hypothetical protein, partial [Wenjunlia tyrosinilytica]|uniref:hypothetical protein n=1 Tax=Wenjunlia tyrosinilytica TaxID=1544741 RepID=UPI001E2A0AE1